MSRLVEAPRVMCLSDFKGLGGGVFKGPLGFEEGLNEVLTGL